MQRVVKLYQSTVGKKIVMALSGAVLLGFVFMHMAGNLKAFQGPESFNAYAEFLRDVGYPLVPHHGVLWATRLLLVMALFAHVRAAWELSFLSQDARRTRYTKAKSLSFSYASRTMRWGGVLVLLFVIYHLLHLTTGQVHPDFRPGNPYSNLVLGFQSPLVVGFYVLAMGALMLHLYHGLWSAFQTLGISHPKYNHVRRPLALGFALLVFLGFVAVPVSVLLGILS